MGKIITIGREFGSGGREVGKCLADKLGFQYYDSEIIKKISEEIGYSELFIKKLSESKISKLFPITIGRSFATFSTMAPNDEIYLSQKKILKQIAANGNCVIVGRCADVILKEEHPLKIFIFSSSMGKKIQRCYDKVPEDRDKSIMEIKANIINIDKGRAEYYAYYTGQVWGQTTNYNLSIDTSIFTPTVAVEMIIDSIKTKIKD